MPRCLRCTRSVLVSAAAMVPLAHQPPKKPCIVFKCFWCALHGACSDQVEDLGMSLAPPNKRRPDKKLIDEKDPYVP